MRLILGTAQLGINYGIANKTGIPNSDEIDKLFLICKRNGIEFCDTANVYGKSHREVMSRGMKIITKLSLVDSIQTRRDINNLLDEFSNSELDTILVHNTKSLLTDSENWKELEQIKKSNKIRIGFSVYYPQEVLNLLKKNFIPDVIQVPYNLFDTKFQPILSRLKRLDIEIHARSVFLQGLFLMDTSNIPNNLNSLVEPLNVFSSLCNHNSQEKIKNSLYFVLQNPYIDKLVVGVEKPIQLLELIDYYNSYNGKKIQFNYEFNDLQKKQLNPSYW